MRLDVSTPFSLIPFLERERGQVNDVLARVAAELADDAPASLRDPIRYALDTPGKRLRPILCVAAWRAGGGVADERVYRLASALEIVHTYSLVHDDLPCMDDDNLRRGRPTLHRAFDVRVATLVGAALIPAAVRVLDDAAAALGLPPRRRAELVTELCRASGARGMVGGQFLDLVAEDRPTGAPELEAIHRRKTGALLAASLRIGALASGAPESTLASLSIYGEAVGLAFQIVDDVLDVTASADALGKTAGKDESVGKATYPALFGIDGARVLASEHVDEAVAALHSAGVQSPELEALARFILERQH
ncbi:MAG TPA: farnesyl diphosphate synthase [Longimicrobium sp.]|nr:farnesyl diphosphate synthase [Longimicrobium sp.]